MEQSGLVRSNAQKVPSGDSVPKFPRHKLFFWLSAVVLLIFLLLASVFLAQTLLKPAAFEQEVKTLSKQIKNSDEDPEIVGIIQRNLSDALAVKDPTDQYRKLYLVSVTGATRYGTSHNPKLREFLEELNEFVQSNYRDLYKKEDFYVVCSDEVCSTLNYPSEILELKNQIEQSDLGLNKQAMLDGLYDAAIAKPDEIERQAASYQFVLQILQNEASTGNETAKQLAQELENFLNENFSDLKLTPNTYTQPNKFGQRYSPKSE